MAKKAVVLLSGGIDSSTTLAIAKNAGFKIYALSFDYNQRHKKELESAKKIAAVFGVEQHLTIEFNLRSIGGSALTSEIDVPKNKTVSSDIPVTYVPARNTIFLSFALAWAETLNAENIFIGANVVDYSGYPDCRPEYLNAFEQMANLATKASVEKKMKFKINAPLVKMSKAEIIKKGLELGLDYSLTWSCYDPTPDNKPCGECDSCVIRANGFKDAGTKDTLLN
jgi:7-cyano-7-deazaguanine synthase